MVDLYIYRETNTQLDRDACHTITPYKIYYWIYCTYRYQRQMDPPVNQAEMPAILLHNISFTTRVIAHKYTKGRWTPHLKVSNSHSSFTLYTALCAIQLFVLSFGVELLDRSVIHLLFIYLFICQLTVVVVLLIAYCCCFCV